MSSDRILVVGLRNPGLRYIGTRHNLGEEAVRAFVGDETFKSAPQGIRCEIVETRIADTRVVAALPTTMMNESGAALGPLVRYFSAGLEDLVVVHDDIDLPFGKMRLQQGRGPGGHNGVSSVITSLGEDGWWRLKLGVGRPPGRMDPADFVLSRFGGSEREEVDLMVANAADVLDEFLTSGGEAARQMAGERSLKS